VALLDQAPGVWRDRLEKSALSLGEECPEGKGGFARAGHTGESDYRVPGQIHVDVLQVVLPGTAHAHETSGRRTWS
jgi:hypothetical protein